MNFCSECGDKVSLKIPEGDTHLRHVCDGCETIHYVNPKIITGSLPISGDRVLLCKRAIEPRYGLWTLPAGFMENEETVAEGAARETQEEAHAEVSDLQLYTVTSVPSVSQVHVFMKGDLVDDSYSAGEESLEVELFTEDEIPWDDIAFSAVKSTLKHYFEDRKTGVFPVHTTDIRHR
ncbi:NUDIX hydrolase [Leucothrix arctica]|uniref:NUDIX hydrolase n=1 Tax=Leucothrix arctica TaxID=1481894 RepID=A0A317C893_9GAMM|nr:NUDIX hydrolase [Leucothrix arctica]PWQ94481.1 NUDIX hydrolase [Leucothrix arctica]